jgi:hypothetical protein
MGLKFIKITPTLVNLKITSFLGNVLILPNALRGGGLDYMIEPYTVNGICRVLRYEGGGGVKRTFPYIC